MAQTGAVEDRTRNTSLLIRGAIWIAIGALIAAALVCVVWVLIGDQNGLIGRAFLTILLLAGFAGIAILEAGLAPKRPDWLALTSMITWIIALIVGAIKIWMPQDDRYFGSGAERFFQLLLVVGILQLALLHVRLYTKSAQRYVTTFTRVIQYVTLALLAILVGMLVFFLTLPDLFDYGELYWRIVVALTILVAVGTTLIPLLNALFAPKANAGPGAPGGALGAAPSGWPTYADGATPLPALYDGSPDWNAYYTGTPTPTPGQGGYGAPAAPQGQSPVWVVPQDAQPQAEAQAQAQTHAQPQAQTYAQPQGQHHAPPQDQPQQSWASSEPAHQTPEAQAFAPQASQPMPEPTPEPVIPGAPEPGVPGAPEPGVPGAPEPTIPAPEPELPRPEPAEPQPVPAPEPMPSPEPAQSPEPAPGQPQPPSGPQSPQHPPAPGAFPPPPPAPAPPQ